MKDHTEMAIIFRQMALFMLILAVDFSTQDPWTFDEHDEMSNKEIAERLEVLTNEVIQIKKDVKEIKSQKSKELGTNTDESEDDEMQKILSVSRKSLSDEEVQCTIRYQQSSTLLNHVSWYKLENDLYTSMSKIISNEIVKLPRGVYETSAIFKVENDTKIWVYIGTVEKSLSLLLDIDDNEDLKETDIDTPLLDISPKGDIVYEPGENATLTIATPLENERQTFYTAYTLVKPEGKELLDSLYSNLDLFHLLNQKKFLEKSEQKLTIATADSSYSGLLTLFSRTELENGLVKIIQNQKQVILRQSTQKQPFPDGKIYNRKIPVWNGKESEDGDTTGFCSYGKTCDRVCNFFGNNLLDLNLLKSVDGKTTQELLDVHSTKFPVSNEKIGVFKVSPVEGDPFPVTYTCITSNVEGQSLLIDHVLYFGREPKILRNETMMKILGNGSVELVCTAKGSPLPKMLIQCDASETVPDVLYQTDDVISVTATCDYVHQWSYLGCSASNDFQSNSHAFHTYGNYSYPINY